MLVRDILVEEVAVVELLLKHVFNVSEGVFRFFKVFTGGVDRRVDQLLAHILAHHYALERIRAVLFRFRFRKHLSVVLDQLIHVRKLLLLSSTVGHPKAELAELILSVENEACGLSDKSRAFHLVFSRFLFLYFRFFFRLFFTTDQVTFATIGLTLHGLQVDCLAIADVKSHSFIGVFRRPLAFYVFKSHTQFLRHDLRLVNPWVSRVCLKHILLGLLFGSYQLSHQLLWREHASNLVLDRHMAFTESPPLLHRVEFSKIVLYGFSFVLRYLVLLLQILFVKR